MQTYQALYELIYEEFLIDYPQYEQLYYNCANIVKNIINSEEFKSISEQCSQELENHFFPAFCKWEIDRCSDSNMFRSMVNYLHRFEHILVYISASRTGDFLLHLQATQNLAKIFFAFNRLKYQRLIPRYAADMYELQQNNPLIWNELVSGNFSVTKNDTVPFTSIGVDHATEHAVKQLKGGEGIVGISNSEHSRRKYFLAMPEMTRMVKEYKEQHCSTTLMSQEHHELYRFVTIRNAKAVESIKSVIKEHCNPFHRLDDKESLWNIVTGARIPTENVHDTLAADFQGQEMYLTYVNERINGTKSIWLPVINIEFRECKKITILDGMYMLRKFEDKHPFKTMKDMANSFAIKIQNELEKYDELVLVWDVYKENSLKKQTRLNRLKGNTHIRYQVRDNTYIQHLSMSNILSHDDTKNDLTRYLSQ